MTKKERKSLRNQANKMFQVIHHHHPRLPHPKVAQIVQIQKQIRKLLCERKHQKAKQRVKTRKKCKKSVSLDSSSDDEAKEKTPKKKKQSSGGGDSDAAKAEQTITISSDKFDQMMNMLK